MDLRLGNIPDKFDTRDFPLYTQDQVQSILSQRSQSAAGAGTKFVLPDLPPVYNQHQIGSCVANAVAAALRYALKKDNGKAYTDTELSRMFIYYNARVNSDPVDMNTAGTPDVQALALQDNGSHNRTAIHSLLTQGVCREDLWPYGNPSSNQQTHVFDNLKTKPNPTEPLDWNKAIFQAKNSSHPKDGKDLSGQADIIPRTISYYRILNPQVMGGGGASDASAKAPPSDWALIWNRVPTAVLEKTLLDGYPFIFGVRIYKEADLRYAQFVQNGVLVKPPTAAKSDDVGGHAMIAVGFDPVKRLFLVQNSWGTSWPAAGATDPDAQGGRFWMPYEWFGSSVNGSPCTYDYWVIKTFVGK